MPSDTLTCDVTPNSLEPGSLSCSMPPLEHLELFAAWGGWVTAGATIILAIFAFAAWKTAQKTLEAMRYQIDDTRKLAEEAREAADAVAKQERLNSTFQAAHTAILDFSKRLYDPLGEYVTAVSVINKTAPAYFAELSFRDGRFAQLSNWALGEIMRRAAAIRDEFQIDIALGVITDKSGPAIQDCQASVTTFLSAISTFQSDGKERDMACHLMKKVIRGNEAIEGATDGR